MCISNMNVPVFIILSTQQENVAVPENHQVGVLEHGFRRSGVVLTNFCFYQVSRWYCGSSQPHLTPKVCLFSWGFSFLSSLRKWSKTTHIKLLDGEQNFILKIDLSNNGIPKAGHYNKKKKFALKVFLLKNTKFLLIYCPLIYLYGKSSCFGSSKVLDWILRALQVNTFSRNANRSEYLLK